MIKRYIICFSSLLLISIPILPIIIKEINWPEKTRNFLVNNAFFETGATNIVSSIYLRYRLYDTVGETIVLLAALMGAIYFISKKEKTIPEELTISEKPSIIKKITLKTNLFTFTVGKLSPAILLFGWYVMFFGHQSPGGGFQGGIVISSGITFLIIGRKIIQLNTEQFNKNIKTVELIETFALLLTLILFTFGTIRVNYFLSNLLHSFLPYVNKVWYIVLFNIAIGMKVGAGTALLIILILREKIND